MRRREAPSSYQVWWRKHPDWNPGRGCIFLYSPFAAAPVRFSQLHSFCFIRSLSLPPSSPPTAARKCHKIRYAFSRPSGKGVLCMDHQHVKEMHPSNFVVAIAFRIFRLFFFVASATQFLHVNYRIITLFHPPGIVLQSQKGSKKKNDKKRVHQSILPAAAFEPISRARARARRW